MNWRTAASGRRDPSEPASGFEALRQSPAFRGPVDPPKHYDHDGDGTNDHFASVYEGRDEQFAAAVPFVRQGLERGEQCVYIADDNSEEAVLAAMREGGIDADAALESGALTIHTKDDTYLRDGEFDRDAMVAFWEAALERADAGGYTGVRAAAEMTWALDGGADADGLADYEALLNTVFDDEDYVVLCQYNRERFPAAVVRDVLRTHPLLIADGTVHSNVYYTPPAEYFGPADPAAEVDRMLGTLRERTEVKSELEDHKQYLREQNRITACPERSFEEKLEALFELGCERFDLEFGAMARVDPETDAFEIEYASDNDYFEPGDELALSETYCEAVAAARGPASVSDPLEAGYEDIAAYRELGLESYLGTYVEVDGDRDRTFFFASADSHDEPFSEEERAFHHLTGRWVQYELERRQRERHQRTLYDIAADTDRTFDQKLEALFELGCERFDLELGGLARIDPETDAFEVEAVSGDHDYLRPGAQVALSETYCRVFDDRTDVAAVTDPLAEGFDGTLAYEEFGVESYLGTRVELTDDRDRTLFFVSSESRAEPFSEAERTFHHLMGQWVKYELEHRHREEQLQRKNDRLESFASLLAHELRNPVTIGQIYGQQLGDADPEAVEYVREAFDRIEDMIDVMLVLTRGREAVDECATVSLAAVAREAWEEVDADAAALTVELNCTVQADETYLHHLFRNLFENAVEHGRTDAEVTVGEFDGVSESSEGRSPSDHSSGRGPREDDAIGDSEDEHGESSGGFYVVDDGPGIPPEDRQKVFETGFTTAAEQGGTGLGLAFVKELAAVYEWDVSVTESASGGARFEFRER